MSNLLSQEIVSLYRATSTRWRQAAGVAETPEIAHYSVEIADSYQRIADCLDSIQAEYERFIAKAQPAGVPTE